MCIEIKYKKVWVEEQKSIAILRVKALKESKLPKKYVKLHFGDTALCQKGNTLIIATQGEVKTRITLTEGMLYTKKYVYTFIKQAQLCGKRLQKINKEAKTRRREEWSGTLTVKI